MEDKIKCYTHTPLFISLISLHILVSSFLFLEVIKFLNELYHIRDLKILLFY